MKREPIVMTTSPGLRKYLFPLASFVVLAAVFAWLTMRSHGVNPTVFADEWYYSKMARLQPLAEAIVPSYLYLWLFGATSACGDGFLECARGANALLLVAGSPFLYLTARTVTGRATAAVIALLAALAPLNLYTAYFMPETAYYFGFCVLSWVALTRRHWHWALHALACGVLLGLMSLVKVHAVFLVPALLLFLAYTRWLAGPGWLGSAVAAMAIGGASMFAVKFGVGYLLAGEPGLSLFGPFYAGGASAASAGSKLRLLKPAFVSSRAHLMVLTIAFGVPLAAMLLGLLRACKRSQAGQTELTGIYTLLMLGAGAGMTILYTATLAYPGSHEGLRLHVRYYSFMFPLLWVIAAAAVERHDERKRTALRWILALLLTAVLAIAVVKLPTYTLFAADSPEAFAMRMDQPLTLPIVALEAAALLLWAAGRTAGRYLFLFVVTPLYIASGIVESNIQLELLRPEQAADTAGKAAHRLVPPAERGKITVAGTALGQIMRAQFHIDAKDTAILELPDNAPLQAYQIPIRNKWLLVFGNHALPPGLHPVDGNGHYALVRLDTKRRIVGSAALNQPFGPDRLLAGAEGLSHPEAFGRWSDAKLVVLHFNAPLPQHAMIVFKAWSYGDNSEFPFTLRAGGSSAQFRLSGEPQEVGLRLDTDGRQRSLTIEVPHPVSPAMNGDPRDTRLLGMALAEIEISTPDD
ncbi:MAG: glycosyltransferase family 39 protein [Telluria sp.]